MHIITDAQYNEYQKYKSLGLTPAEMEDIIIGGNDEAPLPLPLWGDKTSHLKEEVRI